MPHELVKCKRCFSIIRQCKCFDCYKNLVWETCDNCQTPPLEMWFLDIDDRESSGEPWAGDKSRCTITHTTKGD